MDQRCLSLLPEKGNVMRSTRLNPLPVAMVAFLCSHWTLGQTLKPRPAPGQHPANDIQTMTSAPLVTVPMSISAGTPIKVALDAEVPIMPVAQLLHVRPTARVYPFDTLLSPA